MKRYLLLLFTVFSLSIIWAGEKEMPEENVLIGYLAEFVMQHPVVASPGFAEDDPGEEQIYIDTGNKPGEGPQIIVVYPVGMDIPLAYDRKIELKGTLEHIDLGGEEGTKGSYSGDVLYLESWKYLD